jgi:hypothetical protein
LDNVGNDFSVFNVPISMSDDDILEIDLSKLGKG